jgi:Family of unknown function (DUF5946)
MSDIQAAYDELYVYSMGRPNFILQHVVDAHQAQTATSDSKAMGVVFSLVGLYLHVEKRFTGFQVQQAHQKLSRAKQQWPSIVIPKNRGVLTAVEVLAEPAGIERDTAIDRWCETVWTSFNDSRETIIRVLSENRIT